MRHEEHPCEDHSFHVRVDNDTYLYAVFDGHEGGGAAQFALQRMAYEILFGKLEGKATDEEIKEVLRQAFLAVEESYMASIDDRLAERTKLKMDIPDDLTEYAAYIKYPHMASFTNLKKGRKRKHLFLVSLAKAFFLSFFSG